ncbi:MAG TPA: RNA pseudouridine synthase, partial [Thermoanaerobacterales bacterium]|nr:RNA pseudouridine synthase [Thermoanaerobacterales bacterium]
KTKNSKKAITEYEIADEARDFSLVKINLYTGRPHQIRVQLANIGHPVYKFILTRLKSLASSAISYSVIAFLEFFVFPFTTLTIFDLWSFNK